MRIRSELMRWGLLVVLALCVVLMHHVPAQHDHAHHAPAAVATAAMPTPDHGEPPPAPDHGLLHLCLAIIAGFFALLLPFLRRIASGFAELPGLLARTALDRFRPPTPVPRRLAVLCVLRR
ncbi:hypothetical protein [Saccharopolyspora phatthalungensis]|uniref:Uncharacterized protein n=1 Tax=Saccharopolyspora phatthalungensis TaxID=664693 RepID=A0A840Q589_9PSEU|nr:hypothetical protein [Saccharopolyspora phatthalungensis]MBB5157672.1 hypothetical protein [Saccharopolyspora phatthalungensis]